MVGMPKFEVDYSGIWETAGSMADNEIAPQLAKIDQELQSAGFTAEGSKAAINEAYPVARRSLQKSIYENYVAGEGSLAAMGTGRGGGRQELLGRAGERESTGIEAIDTQRSRDVGAIQRALDLYKTQAGTQKASLAGQRGNLQNTYNTQLRATRFGEANSKYNNDLQAWSLAEQARQFEASMAGAGEVAPQSSGAALSSGGNPYPVPDLTPYFNKGGAQQFVGGTGGMAGVYSTPVKKPYVAKPTYIMGKYGKMATGFGV